MKTATIFSVLLFAQTCLAQSETSHVLNVIDPGEIIGIWTGRLATFAVTQKGTLTNGLSSSKVKTNRVPNSPPMINHLVISPYGSFTFSNYTNAKWKIVDQYLVVTTEYGKEIKGFLSPDSLTHEYRLNFEGQLFIREKKFDLDTDKN